MTSPGGPPSEGPPGPRRKRPAPQDYKRKYRPTPPKPCARCGLDMVMLHPLQKYHYDCKTEMLSEKFQATLEAAKNRRASRAREKRKAQRGRRCRWCLRTDKEASWGLNNHECGRCGRQRERKPCPKCDGPRYAGARYCASCFRKSDRGRFRFVVQDAESDRERPYYFTENQLVALLNRVECKLILSQKDFVDL